MTDDELAIRLKLQDSTPVPAPDVTECPPWCDAADWARAWACIETARPLHPDPLLRILARIPR